jgi:hypothetical protein
MLLADQSKARGCFAEKVTDPELFAVCSPDINQTSAPITSTTGENYVV